jgi:hypothetical protein
MSTYIIKINRCDSFGFDLLIPGTKLSDKDVVYFALMYPHQKFEDAILLKGYTENDQKVVDETGIINIKILSSETKLLEPGVYYYTIKLYRGGSLEDLGATIEPDEVSTIIERTKFIINE